MVGGGATVRIDKRRLQQLVRENPQQAEDALAAAAQAILAEIVLSFNTSPPGRTYGRHIASQPGYPPNVDVGTLRASLRAERTGKLAYVIADGVDYGVFLELGTSRMASRPFMTPVIEAWRSGEFARYLAAEWFRGL